MRPSCAGITRPKQRAQGKPGAVAPAASRAKIKKHTSVVTARSTGITRPSLHNGFNSLLRALPGDRACLSPSLAEPCKLDAGVEASGPHDLAVRFSAVRRQRCRVHRIPPRVRDDRASAPLWGGTGRACRDDLPDGHSKIFLEMGLDRLKQGVATDLPVGQITPQGTARRNRYHV
jgi:hypothetical protein